MIVNGSIVFPDPHAGRTAKQSSWYCIGKALITSADAHNASHVEQKVSMPSYTPHQYSRKIIGSTRSLIATTEISKYLRHKSMQEISTEDPASLQRSLQQVYTALCKEYRVLEHCEGNWAAREAVRQTLLNDKAGKTKGTSKFKARKNLKTTGKKDAQSQKNAANVSRAEVMRRNRASVTRKSNSTKHKSVKNTSQSSVLESDKNPVHPHNDLSDIENDNVVNHSSSEDDDRLVRAKIKRMVAESSTDSSTSGENDTSANEQELGESNDGGTNVKYPFVGLELYSMNSEAESDEIQPKYTSEEEKLADHIIQAKQRREANAAARTAKKRRTDGAANAVSSKARKTNKRDTAKRNKPPAPGLSSYEDVRKKMAKRIKSKKIK